MTGEALPSALTIRSRVLVSVAIALLLLIGGQAIHAQDKPPNVLLIVADDLGYSDLGCYGSEIATPNLDGLAKSGAKFSQFYNTARCWPTRSALLTGYYAQAIRRDSIPGVKSGGQGTRPKWAKLLPEMLRQKNYRNYHSGKWHIDGKPLANGFDHSYELGGGSQSNYFKVGTVTEDEKQVPPHDNYYSTVAVADHAVRCLKEHEEKFADRPFFHYLCFTAPHFPLHALPEDIARYREMYQVGWDAIQKARYARQKEMKLVTCDLAPMEREVGPPYAFPEAIEKFGQGEVNRPLPWNELNKVQQEFQAEKMAIHAAMVDRMDQEIGKVLAQLKAMKQFENTVILFLSDNGASAEMMVRGDGHDPTAPLGSAATYPCLGPGWSSSSNTPFRRHKTWVHEGGIATPFIMHGPGLKGDGVKSNGALVHQPGHVIDIVPTILEIAQVESAKVQDGQPVPPRPGKLVGNDAHRALWFLHEENRAIRVGDWKLVALKGQPWELYDLSKDRSEQHNLAEKHPDKVKELEAAWQKQFDENRALALKDATPEDLRETPKKKKGKKQ
ncbi:arylsulfatase [Anatilimnocola sp. NA78]|uniref:arylsulfatase n=1 Tax=Anatilimnocola sp. NA78 TaxID=3415683 RepID=UPI003CE48F1E